MVVDVDLLSGHHDGRVLGMLWRLHQVLPLPRISLRRVLWCQPSENNKGARRAASLLTVLGNASSATRDRARRTETRGRGWGMVVVAVLSFGLACTANPAGSPEPTTQMNGSPAAAVGACPSSRSAPKPPPESGREAPPTDTWYQSADGRLWAGQVAPWRVGDVKVPWIRPIGSTLVIRGRRIDGDAPPLGWDVPEGYGGTFQSSLLVFPVEGCWEVEAIAGTSVLRILLKVERGEERPPAPAGLCEDLRPLVDYADWITVGRVVRTTAGNSRYAWQQVEAFGNWKSSVRAPQRFLILQDLVTEQPLRPSERYVLFLHRSPWRVVCPRETLVSVDGEAFITPPASVPWSEATVSSLENRVRLLAGASARP